MNSAVVELEKNNFSKQNMGVQQVAEEYQSKSAETPKEKEAEVVKKPMQVKDSLQDIQEESSLMGGVMLVVGLGILAAAGFAIFNLDRIAATQELALTLLLIAGGILLAGLGLIYWMIRDTKGQFKQQMPKGRLRFWVRVPTREKERKVMEILRHHGAYPIRVYEY